MAYDQELADILRDLLSAERDVTEKEMFGGIAFLLHGRMAIAAGQGGALVRIDPADSQQLVGSTSAEVAIMRGRALQGWLRVPSAALADRGDIAPWVRRGVDYARSLPPK